MRTPTQLTREEANAALRELQRLLWLETTERDGETYEDWDPHKEHSMETLDVVKGILKSAGLAPDGVTLGDP